MQGIWLSARQTHYLWMSNVFLRNSNGEPLCRLKLIFRWNCWTDGNARCFAEERGSQNVVMMDRKTITNGAGWVNDGLELKQVNVRWVETQLVALML